MNSATNTWRETVKTKYKTALFVIAIIVFMWNRFTVFHMLTHTRSSGDVENTAPFLALCYTAAACGMIGHITSQVIVCLRLPKCSHWSPDWLKQDRRDMRGDQIGYVMIFVMVTAYCVAILVHQFA
jgi:hypothetical protein